MPLLMVESIFTPSDICESGSCLT